ncbi:hypothetical protein ROA7450_00784 [Roseovarius albus]|uniref:DUF4760 domain-containing protein n=1 Tax=Roseovarius albus TaxID=1247867 RepID=A0A1X6YHJ7_9RHOB|nr:hypothetical protein [Roseovarius albus]SLN21696.1 hypothetical protein ROA7450_00784 [Roseovarius albus]
MIRSLVSKIVNFLRNAVRAEGKPITLIFVATGLVITLVQYREHLETKRIKTSYEHVQEWEEEGYKAAFDVLSNTIRKAEAASVSVLPDDLDAEAYEAAKLNVVQRELANASEGELGAEIDKLIYFFDKLSVCVDRNLCDEDLLSVFFRDNLTRMWIYSSSFVAKRRQEIDGYAALTIAYQERLKNPPKPSVWDSLPF